MTFIGGYDIVKHVMYPGKYYITQNGEALRNDYKKPMRMLTIKAAQRRVDQLVREWKRKQVPK